MECSVRAKTRTGALGQGPLYNRKQGGAEFHAPPFPRHGKFMDYYELK